MTLNQKFVMLFFIASALSCSKEKSNKWEVIDIGIVPNGDHLVLVSESDFSATSQYILASGSSNFVWEEDHQLGPTLFGSYYDKQFVLEIPDSLGLVEFIYEGEEIYSYLNCGIYYFASGSKDDGYYRIHKGFISGEKLDNVWIIDFEVFFGGNDNDKYSMIKDAKY